MGMDRRDRLGEPSGPMGRCMSPMRCADLLALAVAALNLPTAPAQDRATDLPLITGLRCACGQPIEPTPLQSAQRADGRFPVAGDPRAELRFTAAVCLAIVGDGSTRSAGSYAHQLGHAMSWLERRIDERGRIGFEARPGWLPVSLIASCAVAEDACTTVEFDVSQRARLRQARVGGQASVLVYTGDHPLMNALGAAYIRLMSLLTYLY